MLKLFSGSQRELRRKNRLIQWADWPVPSSSPRLPSPTRGPAQGSSPRRISLDGSPGLVWLHFSFLDLEDKTEREAWGQPSWRPRGSREEGPCRTTPPTRPPHTPRPGSEQKSLMHCGRLAVQAQGLRRDNRQADLQNFEGFVTKGDSTKLEMTRCHGTVPRSWAVVTKEGWHEGRSSLAREGKRATSEPRQWSPLEELTWGLGRGCDKNRDELRPSLPAEPGAHTCPRPQAPCHGGLLTCLSSQCRRDPGLSGSQTDKHTGN